MSAAMIRAPQPGCLRRHCVTRRCASNRLRVTIASAASSASRASEPNSNATSTALSITASAAASALLAKVTALVATAGIAPGALLTLHQASLAKPSEKVLSSSSSSQEGLAGKVAVALAPAPAAKTALSSSLPAEWHVVSSAADWLEQNRQAAAAGALLATVFISDKAAAAHGPLLERLRRSYGTGRDAPVRFAFVHIGPEYDIRSRAASTAAAALARGAQGVTLGHLSHTAAVHGLDVALSSFLPDGVRAFPSLLLTAHTSTALASCDLDGECETVSGAHWAAATRVSELTQLVSDWAFITRRARGPRVEAPAPAAVTATATVVASAPDGVAGEGVGLAGASRVAGGRAGGGAVARGGVTVVVAAPQQQRRRQREESLVAV